MKIANKLIITITLLLIITTISIVIDVGFNLQGLTTVLGTGIVLITVLILYPLSRDLINDLAKITEYLQQLEQGKLAEIKIKYQDHSEISTIIKLINKLRNNMSKMIESNAQQDWLKTGQTQLNEQLSGEQNIIKLTENIINFLPPYLDAQVGACYLISEDKQTLRMIASHAYIWRKDLANEFQLGEGIVGQAALERKTIIITDAPENYIHIQSGLGKLPPQAILVLPILYEDNLKAVIELASFKVFTENQLEFLNQIMPSIGIALNTAQSRSRMQSLLRKSESQKEDLEIQTQEVQEKQKELEQTNIQLQNQSEKLEKQTEVLQHNNEELQNQSEELQTQQEELRQTNEELEERTHDLEQQKNEIRNKNISLEKAQHAIKARAEEVERANKYKSEFLANMSHELRTPLNSLLILAQILSNNKEGNLTEKQVEYAQTMHNAGSDLLTLINEILDLSKVEAGKMEANIETLSIDDLVQEVQQKFQHVAEKNGVTFNIVVSESIPNTLHTDIQRIQQIINNLLSNAFKFTKQGEVKLTIQRPQAPVLINKVSVNPEQITMIDVTDTGIGIPADRQDSIFEAFQQVDGTTSRNYGGTGLGLSISLQLARLLGGDIQLTSTENKGSSFTLYLPEAKSIEAKSINKTRKLETKPIPKIPKTELTDTNATLNIIVDDRDNLQAEDKSLLIIEDDRKFSRILLELAREKNFKCLIAEDGSAGLQLAEEYKPNAIILDIGLPEIDGWTVMERLKDNPVTRHIPVHFMSGSDHSVDAKRMGAIGYLLKPAPMEQLTNAFQKIEHFTQNPTRNLLIFAEQNQQEILDLVANDKVKSIITTTPMLALQNLHDMVFDCIIIDSEHNSGLKLLDQLRKEELLSQIPVIIYAKQDLTEEEEKIIRDCEANLTIKSVKSPERLLDEATLFLHQVEANLSEVKQNMLRIVHDKEAILNNKTVLLVDDDVRNTFSLMTFLDGKNIQVVVGNNGKEALSLLEQHDNIDIVLMDIMMPEMDGYETIKEIRKQTKLRKLPIIALTAKAMKGDKAKCIEAGANDYLAKPVDTDKLLSLMRVWLYQ